MCDGWLQSFSSYWRAFERGLSGGLGGRINGWLRAKPWSCSWATARYHSLQSGRACSEFGVGLIYLVRWPPNVSLFAWFLSLCNSSQYTEREKFIARDAVFLFRKAEYGINFSLEIIYRKKNAMKRHSYAGKWTRTHLTVYTGAETGVTWRLIIKVDDENGDNDDNYDDSLECSDVPAKGDRSGLTYWLCPCCGLSIGFIFEWKNMVVKRK